MSHLLDSTSLSTFQLQNDHLTRGLLPYNGFELTIIITGPVLRIFGGWQAPFFAFLAWPVPHTYTLSAIFDYMACLVFDREWIG
jgi:hypothetical protein